MNSNIDDRGFTLLEILVSLAILAIALLSILSLQNQTIKLNIYARDLTLASLIAHERLLTEEMKLRGFDNIDQREFLLEERYPWFEVEEPESMPVDVAIQDLLPVPLQLLRVKVRWDEGEFVLTTAVAPGIYHRRR